MNRRFKHTISFTVDIQSELKSGKDIVLNDVIAAITYDWESIAESLIPDKTELLPLSQEEFRNTPDVCPRCGHAYWIQLGEISCNYHDSSNIYQTRKCQKCDEGWTCRFEPVGYLSHSD